MSDIQGNSVFSKIIRREIPADIIYEDERTIAFLDREPLADGHILVVPKTEIDSVWDLDGENYAALWATALKVSKRVQEIMQPARVGCVVEGFAVAHAHIHIVPLYDSKVLQLHHGYPVQNGDAERQAIAGKLRF